MDYSIRLARDSDYGQLCRLYSLGDELHRSNLPHIFQRPEGPARDQEYLHTLMAGDDFGLFVAEVHGSVVGFVSVRLSRAPGVPLLVPRCFAVIDTLVVSGASRRQGIGAALMERAHGWARAKGLDSVELTVWEFNEAAVRFYEKAGYRTERRWMAKQLP